LRITAEVLLLLHHESDGFVLNGLIEDCRLNVIGVLHRGLRPVTPARVPAGLLSSLMPAYDTNLAAEFYVLSCLHRLGITANLTLGNKKGVDIVVVRSAGDAVTVEVKGVAQKYDWPANNLVAAKPDQHFVALVSFEGRIGVQAMPAPRVWIVPFREVEKFKRAYPAGRINVSRAAVLLDGAQFESAWHLIENASRA